MDKEIIIESLKRALESWVRHASAEQLWKVLQSGGLGASIVAEGDAVHARVQLGGVQNPLSELGRTDGRLPVTEAFLGEAAAWSKPSSPGDQTREQWFLASEIAQEHARQYLLAEIGEKRGLLARFAEEWMAG
jgi:ABC-type transport system involved in cytochrome bd biosynthesis fused ATPase/permease subunit